MLKKRLIFTLLYKDNGFYLSRNFRLQRVGGIDWLQNNYKFVSIAQSIDELIILDVSRSRRPSRAEFGSAVSTVTSHCFMPLALGGAISSVKDAEYCISIGADKLVINTALSDFPELIRDLVAVYGSQCIVASVDYRIVNGAAVAYSHQGSRPLGVDFRKYILEIADLKVGEIYLQSIDRDGTGQGFCRELLPDLFSDLHVPIILAGGAGNKHHLLEGLQRNGVDAVATANLFNFIGDGLPLAREFLLNNNIPLARW